MGLIGNPIDSGVRTQIDVRQKKWANNKRTVQDLNVLNANSWLKLASSIDIKNDKSNAAREADVNARVNQLKSRYDIAGKEGSFLAKNLVLLGGSLANAKTMRSGISYSEGYNFGTDAAYGLDGDRFGQRPMPGIESAEIGYYNNGSLSKATITVRANSPNQLSMLETLYLRPGYTILLEWGHESYYSNAADKHIVHSDGISPAFTAFFKSGTTKEQIQDKIESHRKATSYNYDAFFGMITNFEWTVNADATYKVTIRATSLGAISESLKINSSTNSSNEVNENPFTPVPTDPPAPEGESLPGQEFYDRIFKAREATTIHKVLFSIVDLVRKQAFVSGRWGSGDTLGAVNTNLQDSVFLYNIQNAIYGTWDYKTLTRTPWDPYGKSVTVIPYEIKSLSTSKTPIQTYTDAGYYINFDMFLAILQANVTIYSKNGKPYVFLDEGLIPMLTHPGRISADPTICYIDVPDFVETATETQLTFGPKALKGEALGASGGAYNIFDKFCDFPLNHRKAWKTASPGTTSAVPTVRADSGSDFVGYLNTVNVNINVILDALESTVDQNGEVNPVTFIETILSKINDALGNINKFKLVFRDKDYTLEIIDEASWFHKFPANTTRKVFKSYGVAPGIKASILKNISLSSKITNKFSQQISIGAQANQSDIGENAASFKEFNLGVVDRINPRKSRSNNEDSPTTKFLKLSKKLIQALRKVYPNSSQGEKVLLVADSNITTAVSLNRDYSRFILEYFSFTKKSVPSPFFIPFEFSMTLRGLSGVKIYDGFTMDYNLLPASYHGKLKYINTGVDHKIQNNTWETTLKAMTVPDFNGGLDAEENYETPFIFVPEDELPPESTQVQTPEVDGSLSEYDRIKQVVESKGYVWYSDPFIMNIIGVRNLQDKQSSAGYVQIPVTDLFDDQIIFAWVDTSGNKNVEKFAASTDPSKQVVQSLRWIQSQTGGRGVAILREGQYRDTYTIGTHRPGTNHSHTAYLQSSGQVTVYRDKNRDKIYDLDPNSTYTGYFGINIHMGGFGDLNTKTNGWSAGCQIFQKQSEQQRSVELGRLQINEGRKSKFTYTLITSEDLPIT